jgi:hypothetical protein
LLLLNDTNGHLTHLLERGGGVYEAFSCYITSVSGLISYWCIRPCATCV